VIDERDNEERQAVARQTVIDERDNEERQADARQNVIDEHNIEERQIALLEAGIEQAGLNPRMDGHEVAATDTAAAESGVRNGPICTTLVAVAADGEIDHNRQDVFDDSVTAAGAVVAPLVSTALNTHEDYPAIPLEPEPMDVPFPESSFVEQRIEPTSVACVAPPTISDQVTGRDESRPPPPPEEEVYTVEQEQIVLRTSRRIAEKGKEKSGSPTQK
jgi:hypothetical protein